MADWLYQRSGMHIVHGMAQKATNGFLGIDASHTLILFNNKGEVIDQAPVTESKLTLGGWAGSFVKMNGKRYTLEFHTLSQTMAGGLVGGALGAAMVGWLTGPDQRTDKEKRSQLSDVVKSIQGNNS